MGISFDKEYEFYIYCYLENIFVEKSEKIDSVTWSLLNYENF